MKMEGYDGFKKLMVFGRNSNLHVRNNAHCVIPEVGVAKLTKHIFIIQSWFIG